MYDMERGCILELLQWLGKGIRPGTGCTMYNTMYRLQRPGEYGEGWIDPQEVEAAKIWYWQHNVHDNEQAAET
ncbi:hypothetical protein MTR67_034435 [Solanum verrucosum]|uniref:Uncharacterized protein n=1 Tax=Solanum verrucosum TaxID=315347 RepID=A0AAF0U7S1_SOLVR|nr:hypothetical protein MTR67_034435 [Solanum verrucosum]